MVRKEDVGLGTFIDLNEKKIFWNRPRAGCGA